MTDLTKRLAQALPMPHPFTSAHPGEPDDRPLAVELALPKTVPAKARDALATSIETGLRGLASQLGADGEIEISTRDADPGGRDVAGLSVEGRPAAVFSSAGIEKGGADEYADRVVHRVLGRLPLLLGPSLDDTNAAYIAELGRAGDEMLRVPGRDAELAEAMIDLAEELPIVLEVSAETLRRVDESGGSAVADLRRDEFRLHGTHLPDVVVVRTDEPAGVVQLRLNDVWLPAAKLGEQAGWREVVDHLRREIAQRRHWFLQVSHVTASIDSDLQYLFPDLVQIAEANYSPPLVTACLRELIRGGGPVRNLPRILWLLLEQGASRAGPDALRLAESPLLPKARLRYETERDPVVLATRVRKIAIEEAWRLGRYVAPAAPVRLPDELETALLDAAGSAALGESEWTVIHALETVPDARTVVTHRVEAIAPVRSALQALALPPRVVAAHELPPDADLAEIPTAEPRPRPRVGKRGRGAR